MKMNRTNAELKIIAQAALNNEYGFKPSRNNIVLLEASGDGTYILFKVNGHVYRYDDRHPDWVGYNVSAGSIEKES